jgi:hypothetical protein
MMVTSLKEEGNDWVKFRIPVCGLLFGAFQLRADEYDTTVVKADAEEEIKTFQQSPCVKVSDKEFVDSLGEEKKEAIKTAKDTFICLNYPRRCKRSTAQLTKTGGKTIDIGENREPRKGRSKRSEEVVEEACFEDDESLPPELDEDSVCFSLYFVK